MWGRAGQTVQGARARQRWRQGEADQEEVRLVVEGRNGGGWWHGPSACT